MKKGKCTNKGITLIALVITVIVLLILAGVSIAMLTGENGILTKATESKEQTEIAQEKEEIKMAYAGAKANKEENVAELVTAEELNTELEKLNSKGKASGSGTLTVRFAKRKYKINQATGEVNGPEVNIISEKDILYATTYCKEVLALANNQEATEEAEKYRKYFDDLNVDDSEEFLKIHANAVSNYIYSHARNPALKDRFNEIVEKLTYKGEILEENYTPSVQAEYMKNAGALMRAYSRNPSMATLEIDELNKYNPYVYMTLESPIFNAEITYDKELEEVKVAREEMLGDKCIAYARNPSLKMGITSIFDNAVGMSKNENPSTKEQVGAVRGMSKAIIGYAETPALESTIFEWVNTESSQIKDKNLEEVQVARAESLENLISAINIYPSLVEKIVDYYNEYIGTPTETPSARVQAISLYNSGNLLEVLRKEKSGITNEELLENYEKANINITANTDEIQAVSLANLGKLYWTLPFAEESKRETMLEFFKTKLYKEITSDSPIIQAAKYYSEGYYDSAYQEIMKIENEIEREEKLKTLENLKAEFSPDIEIDYSLEEVQIAKIEFLNTIYDSYYTEIGGRYFIQEWKEDYENSPRILQPSEEYFNI